MNIYVTGYGGWVPVIRRESMPEVTTFLQMELEYEIRKTQTGLVFAVKREASK